LGLVSVSAAQLTEQQAKRIEAAVPTKATATPAQPRRLLIWNTPFMDKCPHKGYCVPQAEYAMRLLGEKTGAYESVVSDDVAMYLPENLKQFDAILFNNSNGPWIRPTPEDMHKFRDHGSDIDAVEKLLGQSLLDFVANGGGIVAYHHAVGGNTHWPEFHELLGAAYWGHPWNEEVGIKLDDPDHPLLAAFEGRDFRLADEIFQFRDPYSRDRLRVLLSLDTEKTNMTVPWIHRKDGDFALAWVKRCGKGRVFYSAIGHRTEIWWNRQILRFYLDGIQFAMGDLPADATPSASVQEAQAGFRSLFNGRDLTGWKGNPKLWFAEEGAITGQTTPGHRICENSFLIWTGGDVKDFELRLKFRIESGNSGIYFRSRERTAMHPEPLVGCQADFSADNRWTGVLIEYTRRGILAERGQKVRVSPDGKTEVVGSVGDPTKLLEYVKDGRWNDYAVIADGGHIVLKINNVVMSDVQDDDPNRIESGKLALQVHQGPDMKVQFKDIRVREF
jgi:type 1 glutamine amidotransferase